MSQTEVAMFRMVDVPIGRIEDVVMVAGHCATDDKNHREGVGGGTAQNPGLGR